MLPTLCYCCWLRCARHVDGCTIGGVVVAIAVVVFGYVVFSIVVYVVDDDVDVVVVVSVVAVCVVDVVIVVFVVVAVVRLCVYIGSCWCYVVVGCYGLAARLDCDCFRALY